MKQNRIESKLIEVPSMTLKNALKIILVLMLFTCLQGQSSRDNQSSHSDSPPPFPKQIWTYWDKPIETAPFLVRICHEHIKSVSAKQGWKFTLLSEDNLNTYMSSYQTDFVEVNKNSKMNTLQNIADLVRLVILEEHGGVWIDLSTIWMYGFGWLENLQSFDFLISNKNGPSDTDPDMLLFYQASYQQRLEFRDSEGNLVNHFPGYEIWFIATKPKKPFISEWKKVFTEFYQKQFQALTERFYQEQIYFRNLDRQNYLMANMASYYIMQKKQLQLDSSLSLFSDRANANRFYKVWGLHGQYGPMMFFLSTIWDQNQIMQKTVKQIENAGRNLRFFIKITQSERVPIEEELNKQIQLQKQSNTFDFDSFLSDKPSAQQCRELKFIVQGSVVDALISDNELASSLELRAINTSQRDKWVEYCQKIAPLGIWDYLNPISIGMDIFKFFKHYFAGECARVSEIQMYKSNPSIDQRLSIFISSNAFIVTLCLIAVIVFTFLITLISSLMKLWKPYFPIRLHQQENRTRNWAIIIVYLFSECIVITQLFLSETFGGKNQPFVILCALVTAFILKSFTNCISEKVKASLSGLSLQEIKYFIGNAGSLYLAKQYFVMVENRQEHIVFHGVLCGLIGPWVHTAIKDLLEVRQRPNTQQQVSGGCSTLDSHIQSILQFVERNYFKLMAGFLLSLSLFPNLSYMATADQYLITYMAYPPVIYVLCMLIYLSVSQIPVFLGTDLSPSTPSEILVTRLARMTQTTIVWVMVYRLYHLRFDYLDKLHPVNRIFFEITLAIFFAVLHSATLKHWMLSSVMSHSNSHLTVPSIIYGQRKILLLFLLVPICYLALGRFFGWYVFYRHFIQQWLIFVLNISGLLQFQRAVNSHKTHQSVPFSTEMIEMEEDDD